jgi:hypothetical protein
MLKRLWRIQLLYIFNNNQFMEWIQINIVLLLAIFQATIEHVTENKVDFFQYHAYNDITCFIWLRYMNSLHKLIIVKNI